MRRRKWTGDDADFRDIGRKWLEPQGHEERKGFQMSLSLAFDVSAWFKAIPQARVDVGVATSKRIAE